MNEPGGYREVACEDNAPSSSSFLGQRAGSGNSDQASERVDIVDQDRRLAEIDQLLAMPILKNFINALPAAPRHTAKFPLRDVERHGFTSEPAQAEAVGELQQCFRDSRLELAKQDVLDLFAGLPQPQTQDSQQDHTKIRPVLEHPQKISAVQHQELAVGHCRCIRAALSTVEGRYFAKNFAGIDESKNDFFAVAGQRAYLDASAQYGHQAFAGRSFVENFAASWVPFDPGVPDQRVDFAGAQLSKQKVLLENLPFLFVGRGVHEDPPPV